MVDTFASSRRPSGKVFQPFVPGPVSALRARIPHASGRGLRARPVLAVTAVLAAVASTTAACAQPSPAPDPCPFARHAPRLAPALPSSPDPSIPWFHAVGLALADPGPSAFRNADPEATPRLVRAGSSRVDTAAYRAFRRRVAPLLEGWGRDRRLGINPAFVAALLAKESGFDPRAVSTQAALGYAQLTFAADSDLRIITRADSLSGWMCPEVRSWPRDPRFHAAPATEAAVRALVSSGELRPETEYLLDPRAAARAAVLWLRLLEVTWTEREWPGTYGDSVRARLNGLTEDQLFDLVTASYNLGYPEVWALVREHGPAWKDHLPAETKDYVERIRIYTVLFQRR
jgi:hypothetical protein